MSVPPPWNAPFGSYPKDLHWESIIPDAKMLLSVGSYGRVYRLAELGVVIKHGNAPADIERVWNIMKRAGDACVSLVGRLFIRGEVLGFVMPNETPIDADNIATKEERLRIIYRLRDLVTDLHAKQIVHGDVKPQNLLLCSDGLVRFCDFDCASIEGDGFVAPIYTLPYCSPGRARHQDAMTCAEDMHAMGLSIWHLYAGRFPLATVEEIKEFEDIECVIMDRVFAGFLPDMTAIDDPDIAALIEDCLAAGPERADTLDSGQAIYCITTRFVFGRCTAQPQHTYSRIVHSMACVWGGPGGKGRCEDSFVDPKVFTADLEPSTSYELERKDAFPAVSCSSGHGRL
ncbi:kinase-like domain-containing protein [Mycena pura]|uniref:mitogen-activated protein kinase kinase n=1 Tax=Mycena pura TaxID=153505 RepID=A0AAD6VQV0_9AGAR|nr:kinase-like domain-containing protein [Mycena pura]